MLFCFSVCVFFRVFVSPHRNKLPMLRNAWLTKGYRSATKRFPFMGFSSTALAAVGILGAFLGSVFNGAASSSGAVWSAAPPGSSDESCSVVDRCLERAEISLRYTFRLEVLAGVELLALAALVLGCTCRRLRACCCRCRSRAPIPAVLVGAAAAGPSPQSLAAQAAAVPSASASSGASGLAFLDGEVAAPPTYKPKRLRAKTSVPGA